MWPLHHSPVRATCVGAGHASQEGGRSRLSEHSREGWNMSITRRQLAVASALALGGLGLVQRSAVLAASADEAAVAQAVEALRKAILGQEKTQLEALCAEQPSYGHSDGR